MRNFKENPARTWPVPLNGLTVHELNMVVKRATFSSNLCIIDA